MAGLRYTQGPLQVGGNVTAAAAGRTACSAPRPRRRPTALLRLYATYTLQSTRSVQTVTARLDNATDTLYRNHLNFLKDVVPEIGPGVPPGLHGASSDARRASGDASCVGAR